MSAIESLETRREREAFAAIQWREARIAQLEAAVEPAIVAATEAHEVVAVTQRRLDEAEAARDAHMKIRRGLIETAASKADRKKAREAELELNEEVDIAVHAADAAVRAARMADLAVESAKARVVEAKLYAAKADALREIAEFQRLDRAAKSAMERARSMYARDIVPLLPKWQRAHVFQQAPRGYVEFDDLLRAAATASGVEVHEPGTTGHLYATMGVKTASLPPMPGGFVIMTAEELRLEAMAKNAAQVGEAAE